MALAPRYHLLSLELHDRLPIETPLFSRLLKFRSSTPLGMDSPLPFVQKSVISYLTIQSGTLILLVELRCSIIRRRASNT
jgi:hypothetical protein